MRDSSRDSSQSNLEPASINYRLLRIASEKFGKAPAALEEAEQKEVRTIAAKEYLIEQAVLGSPEAADIYVPESQVNNAAEQISGRYSDEAAFYRELAENNLRLQDLKVALERELRVESVLALIASRTPPIDETEVSIFYYMNRDKFSQPEIRTARHILITVNPQFEENTQEAALARMKQIHKRVVKNTSRFAEQAGKHSECPSGLQGGLLGNVKNDTLYPELSEVLFTMREGQVSDIVESPVGMHILYCEKIRPAGIAPLSDVFEKLQEQLQEKQRGRFTRSWIQGLLQGQAEDSVEKTKEFA